MSSFVSSIPTSNGSAPTNGESTSTFEANALCKAYKSFTFLGYLHAHEIEYAIDKTKEIHGELKLQFVEVNHYEPEKKVLIDCVVKGYSPPRVAEVISQCLSTNQTFVDLIPLPSPSGSNVITISQPDIISKAYQDVQAGISPDEYSFIERVCQEYEPLKQALRDRNLNPDCLVADAWCIGYTDPSCDPKERLAWASMYYYDPTVDHLPYARPIDGLAVRISLTHRKIIAFQDDPSQVFPIPSSHDNAHSFYVTKDKQRTDLKPFLITQPQGVSFQFSPEKSHNIAWQNWSMQIGMNNREGVTIHGLSYANRPILHRLSFAEMVVPYGDPRPPHCWKNAFDAGEDGLGRNANSLTLGCDCLGEITYLDFLTITDTGKVRNIKQAICIHEEDNGIAWKHTDWRTEIPVVARSRRLVISFICTIANYEYGFYYYFYQDGHLEIDVKLTGILSTGALTQEDIHSPPAGMPANLPGNNRLYGINLGPTIYAPVHQHFFVSRMDFAVDGIKNTVYEWNAQMQTEEEDVLFGNNNPHYNAFYYTAKALEREDVDGFRHGNSDSGRFWQIANTEVKNSIGSYVSYKLIPTTSVKPMVNLEKALFLKRAKFLAYQVWVTSYQAEERYPGGDFPNQCKTVEGLPKWIQQGRSLLQEDLVMWHIFGVTHCPRPEEWPIMPVEHCGFKLVPFGFFDSSPAMDLPTKSINPHITGIPIVPAAGEGENGKAAGCALCH